MPSARKRLIEDEDVRTARLLDAQAKAADLFAAIEPRGIIAPGVRETEASDAVRDPSDDETGRCALLELRPTKEGQGNQGDEAHRTSKPHPDAHRSTPGFGRSENNVRGDCINCGDRMDSEKSATCSE